MAIKNMLLDAGIDAEVFAYEDENEGTWEVRVNESDADRARELLASAGETEDTASDETEELDFVSVAATDGALSEMEAASLQSLLDANGINCVVVGNTTMPNFGFEVRVPRADADLALQVIREAREAGPAAAEEGAQSTAVIPDQNGV